MVKEKTFKQILLTYLHQPYRWGGDDPIAGFDCSGLVQDLLQIMGLDPKGDQTAHMLYEMCIKGEIGAAKLAVGEETLTGDLCFYGTYERVIHVGMIFENVLMIEAGGGGSKTKTIQDAIDQNAVVRLRPYNHRSDLVAIYRLEGLTLDWMNL